MVNSRAHDAPGDVRSTTPRVDAWGTAGQHRIRTVRPWQPPTSPQRSEPACRSTSTGVARRVNGVLQPRSTSPRRCCGGLDHQPGPDQLGEVLADGVVVQAEVIGQFGDTDRCVGVGEVLEDRMAGRVAERPSLDLQRRHRCHVDDGSGGLKSAITNDTGRMLANPLVPASEIDSCRPVVDLGHFPLRGGS